MDHPISATATLAPEQSRSTAKAATKPVSFIERFVGECVAGAAGAMALALSEYQDRELTSATKMAGGEAIAKLYKLRQYLISNWDFDSIARTHGRAVLRECCGADITDAAVDALVDETLAVLAKVVKTQLN